jgi:hypothetical protein
MAALPPNTTISTSADLFREEAERARRFAAAMTDQKIIAQLTQIAALLRGAGGRSAPRAR